MTEEMEGKEQPDLEALIEARFGQSMSVPEVFFAAEASRIAEACWAMARRFHQGGRLLAFGNGSWATDAQHVSVDGTTPGYRAGLLSGWERGQCCSGSRCSQGDRFTHAWPGGR